MFNIENGIKESDDLLVPSSPALPSKARSVAKARSISKKNSLSVGAIRDELIYQLSSKYVINWKTLEITQKYFERAEFVLYRINLWNPASPPVFTINTSDLTLSLYAELEQLKTTSPGQFDRIVTEAVQTILESINGRYYHIAGLPYKVIWRFEP